jgi:hypothetical protein
MAQYYHRTSGDGSPLGGYDAFAGSIPLPGLFLCGFHKKIMKNKDHFPLYPFFVPASL